MTFNSCGQEIPIELDFLIADNAVEQSVDLVSLEHLEAGDSDKELVHFGDVSRLLDLVDDQ